MVSAIQQLREVAMLCAAGQPLRSDLSRWLAESLDRFLSHRATTVEQALGILSARGGIPWWREEAIRQRGALLRQLAVCHFSELSVTRKSKEICRLAHRYATSAWRFDRDRDEMPGRYVGTPLELLFKAFRLSAPMPISERHLRTILGGLEAMKTIAVPIAEFLTQCESPVETTGAENFGPLLEDTSAS